jgi:hypothetical protein
MAFREAGHAVKFLSRYVEPVDANQSDCPRLIHFFGGLEIMARQQTASTVEAHTGNDRSSDDECVQRLAALIELRDSKDLTEIASLIGRLAVPVALPGL